jgi:hypothetical protein
MEFNRRAAPCGGLSATLAGLRPRYRTSHSSALAPVELSVLTVLLEVLSPTRSPIRRARGPAPMVALVACLTLSPRPFHSAFPMRGFSPTATPRP